MTSAGSAIHVFLADDSAAIRERVHAMLTGEGMHVDGGADTPQACIDAILAEPPDVVVLDIQLKGGTGMQVLEAVRRANPRVAFIVFSNNSGAPYRARYLSRGAAGFLDKMTESDRLAQAIRVACRTPHA